MIYIVHGAVMGLDSVTVAFRKRRARALPICMIK